MQQGAKLCVGVVQDWVTVELAVRIRVSKSYGDITEAGINRLHSIFKIVFAILIAGLTSLIITVIVSAHQPGNDGSAFSENYCQIVDIVGYLFLGQVIVMVLLVIWLFIETLRESPKERRDREQGYLVRPWPSVRKYLCFYATISFFFALSYIGRFLNNNA